MKIGDIVQWTPVYAQHKYMPRWMGIIIEIKEAKDKTQVKVYWFSNNENYYMADWTSVEQLKRISSS